MWGSAANASPTARSSRVSAATTFTSPAMELAAAWSFSRERLTIVTAACACAARRATASPIPELAPIHHNGLSSHRVHGCSPTPGYFLRATMPTTRHDGGGFDLPEPGSKG